MLLSHWANVVEMVGGSRGHVDPGTQYFEEKGVRCVTHVDDWIAGGEVSEFESVVNNFEKHVHMKKIKYLKKAAAE